MSAIVTIALILTAGIVHELSHFIVAWFFGGHLQFHFGWGRIHGTPVVPRFLWTMPDFFINFEKKVVAIAGFAGEFLFSLVIFQIDKSVALYYLLIAILHLGCYHFYAGEESDFKWVR